MSAGRRWLTGTLLCSVAVAGVTTQTPRRHATSAAAVRAYPAFFHLQPVALAGAVSRVDGRLALSAERDRIWLITGEPIPEGVMLLQGEIVDVGRMNRDDERIAIVDRDLRWRSAERWPRPGEDLALIVSHDQPHVIDDSAPTPRSLALLPGHFAGRSVTVTGQFRGRNLFADLPAAPPVRGSAFVLRADEGAVWVTGLHPSQVNLDPNKRTDEGVWLRITGTAHQAQGLVWIEAATMALSTRPATSATLAPVPVIPPPPLEVVFSAPIPGEADVRLDTRIRLQMSRDLDIATLKNRIRLGYSKSDSQERGEPQPPAIEFTYAYRLDVRALEIVPVRPLERFREVTLELLEGIRALDGAAMKPWTLTFTTGGS